MDNFKFYTWGLVTLVVANYIILLLACFYLEPPTGDTTRVSGYSENDYGWNVPQKAFAQLPAPLQEVYDHYADILVVGDSFSFGGVLGMMNYPWQSFLTAETGWSVSTVSHYTTKTNPPSYDPTIIPQIVNSDTFQKTPPKVFVLEVVERQLNILPKISGECKVTNKIHEYESPELRPISNMMPIIDVFRDNNRPPLNKRYAYAVDYLDTLFHLNYGDTRAFLFDLKMDKLFSSKKSGILLVYEGDVKKKNWNDHFVEDIRCRLINFQNLVQKNGKTLFVVMVAPDKLTTYSPLLKDASSAKYSPISRLSSDKSLHLPRFDLPLQSAVTKEGVVDLYLPNDTHWAGKGQQIAAKTLLQFLLEFSGD